MFDPMFVAPADPLPELIVWAVAITLAVIGFWWIHRITKDIEDN